MSKYVSCLLGLLITVPVFAAESVFSLDASHSSIGFSVRHMGITNVRGQFGEFDGSIRMGEDIESLSFEAVIQASSVDTNNEGRDDHLRNEDFFEVETFPVITFKSTGIEKSDEDHVLVGELTMKETTREVRLPITVSGPAEDPWGNTRIGLHIGGSIERHDYGVGFAGASDRLIGNTVTFDINLQAIEQ